MRSMRNQNKENQKIADERIEILLTRADKIYKNDPVLAQRYGEMARKIAMRVRQPIPHKWRMRFCKKCKKLIYPGINAHIRVKGGKKSRIILFCRLCNKRSHSIIIDK